MTTDKQHDPKIYTPEKMLEMVRADKSNHPPCDEWKKLIIIETVPICEEVWYRCYDGSDHYKYNARPCIYLQWRETQWVGGGYLIVVSKFESIEAMDAYVEKFKELAGDDYEIIVKVEDWRIAIHEENKKKISVEKYVDNKCDIGHICYNGTIKPYPSGLCSCCMPSPNFFPVHVDLTAFSQAEREQWDVLARKIFKSHKELEEKWKASTAGKYTYSCSSCGYKIIRKTPISDIYCPNCAITLREDEKLEKK